MLVRDCEALLADKDRQIAELAALKSLSHVRGSVGQLSVPSSAYWIPGAKIPPVTATPIRPTNLYDVIRSALFGPATLKQPTYLWDVWSDHPPQGWTAILKDAKATVPGICLYLASAGPSLSYYVTARALDGTPIPSMGPWSGDLLTVRAGIGCSQQSVGGAGTSRVGQKIQLSYLPAISLVWEVLAYNYAGVAGWSKAVKILATKAQFCAHVAQLPMSYDDPAVQVTARTQGGGLVHAPWKGPLSVVRQQIGCG
jgi:hypothetical protein